MTFESGSDFFRETGCCCRSMYGRRKIARPLKGHFVQRRMPRGFASARCSYRSATPANEHRVIPWAQVEFGEPPCR